MLATLLISCSDGSGDGLAYAVLSITNDRARTISTGNESVEITKYVVKLTPISLADSYEFTFEKNSTGTYSIDGVIPGEYSVLVEAKTQNDTIVSQGSTTHRFTRGEKKTFSVTLNTLYGNQDTTITYTWDTNIYSADADFQLKITDEKGNVVSTDGCISKSNGKAVFQKNLAAGSYLFVASLYEGIFSVIGYTEVVRVTNGPALSHTIDLSALGASAGINTASIDSSSLYVPLTGTLELYKVGTYAGAKLTLTNLPEGITENDVTITWYVEDFVNDGPKKGMTTTTFTVGTGVSIVTAVMQCEKTGSMGSVTGFYTPT